MLVVIALVCGKTPAKAADAGPEPLSPLHGLLIGAGSTVAPVWLGFTLDADRGEGSVASKLLVAGGLALGPATGLLYARRPAAAAAGAIGRAVLLGGAFAYVAENRNRGGLDNPLAGAGVPLVLGTGAFVWAVVDVLRTPAAVTSENARRTALAPQLAVIPGVAGATRSSPGITVVGTF